MSKSLTATKHFTLAKQLRAEFSEMRAGEPVYTVEQLKSRFGVSQATVTRALDRLTREGMIYRPDGRNRLVIAEMRPRGLHRVAIIRPSWPSPDYDAMVRGLMEIGRSRGWTFELYASAADVEELDLNRAVGSNDGAIMLFSAASLPQRMVAALRRPRKPVVLMRELPAEQTGLPGVALDDEQVGRVAVEHLIALGHRRIMAVVSEPAMRSVHERITGWRQALRAHGIDPEGLLLDCNVPEGSDSIRHTYEVFSRWLARDGRPDFTAIFCIHWTGALAVSRALRERTGMQTPQDVSMVAYAGESLLLPYLNPPLTSVEFDMTAYATAAIDMLEQKLEDASTPAAQVRITPFLVERGSTRALGST